jgi:hypothetical protein
VDNVTLPTEPSPRSPSRSFDFRLALGALLLLPTLWFTWLTGTGLTARRDLRTDLADMDHVRYGLLNADRWRDIIAPMLNGQIDKMDLKAQTKNLRPMVERSLNALLDNILKQSKAPVPPGTTPKPGLGNPMMVGMIVASLKPQVPDYTTVVLAELAKPQNEKTFKDSFRSVLAAGIKNSFSPVDMTKYAAILQRHGCADAQVCEATLNQQIAEADQRLTRYSLAALGFLAAGFILLTAGRPALSRTSVFVLMLFCIIVLVGGVLSPMLEVEVRIAHVSATLMGSPVDFRDQSLYYRSKTVLEVFQTLIEMHQPQMTLVAVLLLLFSVIFPALKMLALSASLIHPALLRNRIVKFFAFDVSKWSMADVLALAIFMSFVAFNGIIASGMAPLRDVVGQLAIPTNSSEILPGYYLFIGFCVASIILSKKLEQGIAVGAVSGSS